MNNIHKHQLIIVGVVILALVLWMMSRGKSVSDIVNQVAGDFKLPTVTGGDNIYNIPALNIKKGCGQSACSFNIIPQMPNGINPSGSGNVGIGVQANPAGDLARAIGRSETQSQLDQNMITATHISNPPLYPWAVDRFY